MIKHRAINISKHYDISNSFYEAFLGKHMLYTTTHFNSFNESLDASEEIKLKNIANILKKNNTEKLLEIGCGWGSYLIYLAQKHKIKCTGITLSKEQFAYVNNKIQTLSLQDYINVKYIDFFDFSLTNQYDAILSIGVMSHIPRKKMPEYYSKVHRLLNPQGIYYQDCITRGVYSGNKISGGKFMGKEFFPGSESFDLDFLIKHINQNHLETISLRSLRKDYERTLGFWVENIKNINKNQYPEKILRKWELALTGAQLAFAEGYMNDYEIICRKYIQ